MKAQLEVLDSLFPKTRADILRLLFSGKKRQCYVRKLTILTGLALRTIRKSWPLWTRLASSQAGLMDITVSIARIELTRSLPICAASFKQARTFRAPSCHHIAGDVFDPKWERERRIAANAPSLPERWSPPKFPPVMSRIMAKRRTRCPVAPQARCLCYVRASNAI